MLEFLFKIIGLGSASGIVYNDDSLFIISDNSSFLYQYHVQKNQLFKIKLLKNSQENIPKKDKFDFEAIALKENNLHILGSGSTSKREKRIIYNLDSKKKRRKRVVKIVPKSKTNRFYCR